MEEASANAMKFIDRSVHKWIQHITGSTIPHQMEQQVIESSSMQGDTQALQKRERITNYLQRRLKESQEAVASLSTSLETGTCNNAEFRSKLNTIWENIELSFKQHHVNLTALYNDMIQKQKEAIEKLQLDNALKTKDLEDHVMQLKNELQLREKRMQNVLTEQSKLASALAEEKKILVEEQQRLLSKFESLQSQVIMLEQEKTIIETVTQKDALLSKLQDEIAMYNFQVEMMQANNNEASAKYEALTEKQNILEKESREKSEKIQNLETKLSAIKQSELNDTNTMEKKLNDETKYSKDLANKLLNVQKDLQFEQKRNIEMQKTLEMTKSTSKIANVEFQRQLKVLQVEKAKIIRQKNTKIKAAEVLYKNMQANHAKEVSALKSGYKTGLLELKKAVDSMFERINVREENAALNTSLLEVRAENSNLKENLEQKLEETALQTKSMDDPKSEGQVKQKAEVTLVGRKFFKSGQPLTYSKRQHQEEISIDLDRTLDSSSSG